MNKENCNASLHGEICSLPYGLCYTFLAKQFSSLNLFNEIGRIIYMQSPNPNTNFILNG